MAIDGVTPETYARIRVGGRLEKFEANVLRLLEARGERRRPKLVLWIIRMQDTAAEIDAFFERWRPLHVVVVTRPTAEVERPPVGRQLEVR